MSRRKRRLVYPLGAVLVGAVKYFGTEVRNTMDASEKGWQPTINDPVAAAWKGVGYWTALYPLVRLTLRRPATAKRYGKAFLKSSAAFNLGFFGAALLLGRSFSPDHDDSDAALVGNAGLMGGTVALVVYHLIHRARRKPATTV